MDPDHEACFELLVEFVLKLEEISRCSLVSFEASPRSKQANTEENLQDKFVSASGSHQSS